MIIHGVGLNFGVDSTIIGVNGAFQQRDHNYIADAEPIKDAGETTVSKAYWDFREQAVFNYVAYNGTNIEDALVQIPTVSSFISIIDPRYPAIAGRWLVDDVSTQGSNTSAVRVTVKLSRYPFLSAV